MTCNNTERLYLIYLNKVKTATVPIIKHSTSIELKNKQTITEIK